MALYVSSWSTDHNHMIWAQDYTSLQRRMCESTSMRLILFPLSVHSVGLSSPYRWITYQDRKREGVQCIFFAGLGIRSSVFWANCLFFAKKWANERFAQKNEWLAHSLIFGEQPERFTHGCSFLVSNLSKSLMVAHFWWATCVIRSHHSFLVSILINSLTSLTKNEGMSESLIFFKQKNLNKTY